MFFLRLDPLTVYALMDSSFSGLLYLLWVGPLYILSGVEPQTPLFVNFTSCEELEPIRHFWQK